MNWNSTDKVRLQLFVSVDLSLISSFSKGILYMRPSNSLGEGYYLVQVDLTQINMHPNCFM